MTTLDIVSLFPNSDYPSRAEVAEIMVEKFLPQFESRLFLQGKNRIYYEELLKQLEGKKQEEQYDFIMYQLAKLDNDEIQM